MKTVHYVKVVAGEVERMNIRFPMYDFYFKVSARVNETFYPFSGNPKVKWDTDKEYLLGFHIGCVLGRILERYSIKSFDEITVTLEIEIEELYEKQTS